MARALFPFYCYASPAAADIVGANITTVAVVALRAAVRQGRGLDIAHMQIEWGEHTLAFSSRIGKAGDVVVELEVGQPGLTDRLISEDEMRAGIDRLREEHRRRKVKGRSSW